MRIAIVGAGILGCLTALRLRREGVEVHLLEQRCTTDISSASWSAGGLLTPVTEALYGEKVVSSLGRHACSQWATLLSTMTEPFTLSHRGSLVVAPPEAVQELEEWTTKIRRLVSPEDWRPLDPHQLIALEPAFDGMTHSGLWIGNEGYLDPRSALRAIHKTLVRDGVVLTLGTQVEDLTGDGIRINSKFVPYSLVIDTRGLSAQPDWPELRGIRGEALVVEAPGVTFHHPMRILHARHPIYIVPRGPGTYYVGATTIESESLAPIQVQSILEILTNLASFYPGFRYAHIRECITQVRPTLDHHLPRISIEQGVVRANGLYRHGFLLGPAMSQAVCDLVLAMGKKEARSDQHHSNSSYTLA